MDAVEVEGNRHVLSIDEPTDFVLVRIPSGEAGDKVPNPPVIGVENVGPVVLDANAVAIPVVVAVATDMVPLVDDSDMMPLLR